MRARLLTAAAVAVGSLVVVAAWMLDLSLEKAALLAPVIVATVGATAALVVLWARIVIDTLGRQRHPGRIVAGGIAAIALLVILSFFVELPAGH